MEIPEADLSRERHPTAAELPVPLSADAATKRADCPQLALAAHQGFAAIAERLYDARAYKPTCVLAWTRSRLNDRIT